MKLKDYLIGKKFNKLTLIRYLGTRNHQSIWLCQCDCGSKPIEIYEKFIKNGNNKSCGCLGPGNKGWSDYKALYNVLISEAKRGNKYIDISYEDYVSIIKENLHCTYCDDVLIWSKKLGNHRHMNNNLDRKDCSLGYLKSNVVACCPSCNKTRGDRFSYEEFLLIGKVIKQIRLQRMENKNDSI
jgi:hypothetical protein